MPAPSLLCSSFTPSCLPRSADWDWLLDHDFQTACEPRLLLSLAVDCSWQRDWLTGLIVWPSKSIVAVTRSSMLDPKLHLQIPWSVSRAWYNIICASYKLLDLTFNGFLSHLGLLDLDVHRTFLLLSPAISIHVLLRHELICPGFFFVLSQNVRWIQNAWKRLASECFVQWCFFQMWSVCVQKVLYLWVGKLAAIHFFFYNNRWLWTGLLLIRDVMVSLLASGPVPDQQAPVWCGKLVRCKSCNKVVRNPSTLS